MSLLDEDKRTAISSDGDGVPKAKVIPPPPPPTAQVLSIVFALLALGAVLFRSWDFCTGFTALSVVLNVVSFLQVRAWAGRAAEAAAESAGRTQGR
jgi:hypothetical protein